MVDAGWLVFFGLMATVAAGVFVIVRSLKHREQMLELAHRERMAMIEKGLVPSPEADPGHVAWVPPGRMHQSRGPTLHDVSSSHRSMTLGIVLVAIGLGFMSVIGVAARTPTVAVGLGGAIVIVGAAFIVIGQVKRASAGQSFSAPPPPFQGAPPVPMNRPPANPDGPSDHSSL